MRAAAGQTEPALFPCRIGAAAWDPASLRSRPTSTWRLAVLFTQVSSLPREAGALQTSVTTCFHKMDAHICMLPKGETEAQQTNDGSRKVGQVFRLSLASLVTRLPLSCQTCPRQGESLWAFHFRLQQPSHLPRQAQAEVGAPRQFGVGAGVVIPQPHLSVQPCTHLPTSPRKGRDKGARGLGHFTCLRNVPRP